MKKRMVPVAMAVIMALSLAACGKEKTVSSAEVSETTVSSVEEKEEAVEKGAPAKEETVTEASVETVAETSVEASEEEEVVILGRIEDDVYYNDYFGIKITPAEGVSLADDSMLDLLNNITQERLANSDSQMSKLVSKMLKDGRNIIDAYAYEGMGLNSLNVTAAYIGEGLNEDFAYALSKMTASSAESIYGPQGMDVESSEASTLEISGKEIPCVKTAAKVEANGATLDAYILQAIIVIDGYEATITAGSYMEDNTEKLFEMVSLFE